MDGLPAVHSDFVDQGLQQGLDGACRSLGDRLGDSFTEHGQLFGCRCGEVGVVHLVCQLLASGSKSGRLGAESLHPLPAQCLGHGPGLEGPEVAVDASVDLGQLSVECAQLALVSVLCMSPPTWWGFG